MSEVDGQQLLDQRLAVVHTLTEPQLRRQGVRVAAGVPPSVVRATLGAVEAVVSRQLAAAGGAE